MRAAVDSDLRVCITICCCNADNECHNQFQNYLTELMLIKEVARDERFLRFIGEEDDDVVRRVARVERVCFAFVCSLSINAAHAHTIGRQRSIGWHANVVGTRRGRSVVAARALSTGASVVTVIIVVITTRRSAFYFFCSVLFPCLCVL